MPAQCLNATRKSPRAQRGNAIWMSLRAKRGNLVAVAPGLAASARIALSRARPFIPDGDDPGGDDQMTLLSAAERLQSCPSLNSENLDSDSSPAPTRYAFAPRPIRQYLTAVQRFRGPSHQNRHPQNRGLRPLKWGVEMPKTPHREANVNAHLHATTTPAGSHPSVRRLVPRPTPGSLDSPNCHGE